MDVVSAAARPTPAKRRRTRTGAAVPSVPDLGYDITDPRERVKHFNAVYKTNYSSKKDICSEEVTKI